MQIAVALKKSVAGLCLSKRVCKASFPPPPMTNYQKRYCERSVAIFDHAGSELCFASSALFPIPLGLPRRARNNIVFYLVFLLLQEKVLRTKAVGFYIAGDSLFKTTSPTSPHPKPGSHW